VGAAPCAEADRLQQLYEMKDLTFNEGILLALAPHATAHLAHLILRAHQNLISCCLRYELREDDEAEESYREEGERRALNGDHGEVQNARL
jgi:hypothetical protein